MKTIISIAIIVINMRLLADFVAGSHCTSGTYMMPAKQPSHGYYGQWCGTALQDTIRYDENGKPIHAYTAVLVQSSWESSYNIDLTLHPSETKAFGNANITWDEEGSVTSSSDYGEDTLSVEIYE